MITVSLCCEITIAIAVFQVFKQPNLICSSTAINSEVSRRQLSLVHTSRLYFAVEAITTPKFLSQVVLIRCMMHAFKEVSMKHSAGEASLSWFCDGRKQELLVHVVTCASVIFNLPPIISFFVVLIVCQLFLLRPDAKSMFQEYE